MHVVPSSSWSVLLYNGWYLVTVLQASGNLNVSTTLKAVRPELVEGYSSVGDFAGPACDGCAFLTRDSQSRSSLRCFPEPGAERNIMIPKPQSSPIQSIQLRLFTIASFPTLTPFTQHRIPPSVLTLHKP